MRARRYLVLTTAALWPVAAWAQLLPAPTPLGAGLSTTGNTISVTYGSTAGTAAQGNDPRIVGALPATTAASTYLPIANPTVTGTLTAPAVSLTGSVAAGRVLAAPQGAAGAPGWRTLGHGDIADWSSAVAGFLTSAPVASVAGRTGAVTISLGDVGGAGSLAGLSSLAGLDASTTTTLATGGTTARTIAARAADALNVKDFGARCDGSTDDTAAINAAFNYARTAAGVARVVFPSGAVCRHTGTLNWTGLRSQAIEIAGGGATLDCEVSGGVCIDALYSRWLRVHDLTVTAAGSAVPTIGLQIGTIDNNVADSHTFENLTVSGNFSVTAVYSRRAETTLWNHLQAWNSYGGGTAYCLILDGYNHWGVTSSFQTVTLALDTTGSFQENTFVTPDFRRTGVGGAVWSGSTMRHRYIGGYVGNTGASNYGFVLYGYNSLLDADVHFEAYPYLTDGFYVTAPAGITSETLNGLRIRDNLFEGSNSILKVDTALTGGVALTNADIEIGGFSNATKVFDSATPWTVSGSYKLPSGSTAWNLASSQFAGTGAIGAAVN